MLGLSTEREREKARASCVHRRAAAPPATAGLANPGLTAPSLGHLCQGLVDWGLTGVCLGHPTAFSEH